MQSKSDKHGSAPKEGTKGKPSGPRDLNASTPVRGASLQGERQDAKGGPAGANQGGAPRGGSRVEPSHQKSAAKKDRAKK